MSKALRISLIVSLVVACIVGSTFVAVDIFRDHSKSMKVSANETEEETTRNNIDRLNTLVGQIGENKADAQYEEDLYQAIAAFVEEMPVVEGEPEPEPEPVPIIAIEELVIVEDTSEEPPHQEEAVEVVEETSSVSSEEIYEINQLVHGIDVSKWQGEIDWTAVAADGISFAIIKCGGNEGGLYEDKCFKKNIQGALANGIQVGVYFYSGAYDVETAYQEASMVINLIKDYQITYPVALDWENAAGDSESITRACETFCNVIASYGYTPMIYSNRNRWYNYFDGEKLSKKYKTWMACYFNDYYYTSRRWVYGEGLPEFRYNYDMWQYGVTNTVAGINGYVDMNIAFFGYANYKVEGVQDATLTVTNKELFRYLGSYDKKFNKELNLLEGVKGTNSIGYDAEVSYTFLNSENEAIPEEEALTTAGTYKVEYSFKDPKTGMITAEATLVIEEVKEEVIVKDFEIELSKEGKIPSDINFTAGVSCTSSLDGECKLTKTIIKKTEIETGEIKEVSIDDIKVEIIDFEKYTYSVEYTFEVPKMGDINVKVEILDKNKKTDTNE